MTRWILLLSLALIPAPALAQEDTQSPAETVAPAMDIPTMSGGVTLDEREALKEKQKNYNLKLMFALSGGPYLSEVMVKISDKSGAVLLETLSDGPFFLAKLPVGDYTIEVNYNSISKTQKTSIPAYGYREINFYWKDE